MPGNGETEQSTPTRKPQVMHMNPRIEKDRQMITNAREKGQGAIFKTFIRLSGPGWLQSGITLGGGSLSSSLYLGVLVGFSFMWLQPLAMILGIVMLSAIAYVTLSTGERPLRAISEHVNPVLAWGWLLASMVANLVWSLPQFALGTAAIQQNLFPRLVGPEVMPDPWGKILVGCCFLAVCITVTFFYGAGGRGVKVFEFIIKAVVSMIVLCFFGVVVKLSLVPVESGGLDWTRILRGLVPDLRLLYRPTAEIMKLIAEVDPSFQGFWTSLIVGQQRDVMISAAATAVGINMTFLLPYSMLRKGWDKDFRGLAVFDLSTGLFIPFIIATGCVVIASASQFHAVPEKALLSEVQRADADEELVGRYNGLLAQRLKSEIGIEEFAGLSRAERTERVKALPYADKKMAATLVKRDAFNLADTLAPLFGKGGKRGLTQYLFGLGVMGMAMSAATMLMTINGLCFCELLGRPPRGWTQRVGALMVSVGALGPLFWKDAKMWLAVPTSVFAFTLIPIAYLAFLLLMNQKRLLGDCMPRGGRRVVWNVLMIVATGTVLLACPYAVWSVTEKRFGSGWYGVAAVAAYVGLAVVAHIVRKQKRQAVTQ